MTTKLDGPRLAAKTRGKARQLVVLLHGYGADGNDLIEIGAQWQALMPDAAFVAPQRARALRAGADGPSMVSPSRRARPTSAGSA